MENPRIDTMSLTSWDKFNSLEHQVFPEAPMEESSFIRAIDEDGFMGLYFNDLLAGYLLVRSYEEYGHINRIGVHPKYQSRGYGSKLMEKALQFCIDRNLKKIGLYVETNNEVAIKLYKKYGFRIANESWHYIIKFDKFAQVEALIENNDFVIRELKVEELEQLVSDFPSLKIDQIRDWMISQEGVEPPRMKFPVLEIEGKPQVFGRFSPAFSGCMPFVYSKIDYVNYFIKLMKKYYVEPDKDYIRLTFDNYKEIAHRFDEQGYQLYHHLFKMETSLSADKN